MGLFRRHAHLDADAPDPAVEAWFARAALPGADDATLERARGLVAAKLAESEPATGSSSSFMRRLGWATAGGGGLWASTLGAAAAHPLISTVAALALVGGGATAVEVSGMGPAVRETVGFHTPEVQDAPPQHASATPASAAPTTEALTTEGHQNATVAPAHEDLPGNLLTQIHDGRFVLRAQLVAVGDESLSLLTPAGEVTVPLADDIDIHVAGKPDPDDDLGAATGQLVMVFGSCNAGVQELGAGCVIERVHVLGGPVGGGAAGNSEGSSGSSDSSPGASRGKSGEHSPSEKDKGPQKNDGSSGKRSDRDPYP